MTTPHLAARGLALVLCLIPSLSFARAGDANRDGAVTVTDGVQLLQKQRGAAATRALRRALAPAPRGTAHRARSRAARGRAAAQAITTVEVRLTFTATTTLQGYQIEVGYPVAKGDFQGSGGSVACVSNGGGGFFFANDDDAGKLIMNQGSAVDLTFPFDVVCRFDQNDGSTLAPADLTITTVEVVHEGAPGDPATLQVAVAVGPVTPSDPGCSPTPRTGCLGADGGHQPTLLIADSLDRRDELAWRFPGGTATSGSPFGNPQVDTDYAFCAYSATPAGYEQLLQFAVPAGPRWRQVGDGFVYRDETNDSPGLDRIELSTGTKGPARIVVKAEGKDLPLPTLPLTPPLIVQLQTEATCWEATYEATDLTQNDATRVRAPGR